MNRRVFLKQVKTGSLALASLPVLGALAPRALADGESLVRWDIVQVAFDTIPTVNAGGEAFASLDADRKIKFTGSGEFIAPEGGGTSSHVSGGGTWETFDVRPARGTFEVKKLLSWQQSSFFPAGQFIDQIGEPSRAATGNAILLIEYSDGNEGTLGIGCENVLFPVGIQEGVIATKGFFTYWTREAPGPGVDKNRTVFHVT